jgi:hypothetical protein
MDSRLVTITAGASGSWRIDSDTAIRGPGLAPAAGLTVMAGDVLADTVVAWSLRGIASHPRYASRAQLDDLARRQPSLGRPTATRAALILIRKSATWWAMGQDERLAALGPASRHAEIGTRYLPAIARRLLHCRDLSAAEPFDFLTWFEFAPEDGPAFDRLCTELRATSEWEHVEREVDIRLRRD